MRQSIACSEALARIEAWAHARRLDFRHDSRTGFGALFSPCGTWRYLLWRMHHPRGRVLGMGMLNPSTADEHANDPTIARCHDLARRLGYPGLLVWNLFALRATDPAELRKAADPVGPDNDAAIGLALILSRETIVAWGNHGALLGRNAHVLTRCLDTGVTIRVLGVTGQGHPRHPLYLRRDVRPQRWFPATSPAPSSR
ncbi:MAG: DUF1643 domain-containing protein [Novosphingobium sp.]